MNFNEQPQKPLKEEIVEKTNIMQNTVEKSDGEKIGVDKNNIPQENVEITSDNAENVENVENTETASSSDKDNGNSLGKFKDAESLLKAYNSLQSEFTKRCQRVKELEAQLSISRDDANSPSDKTGENTTPIEISDKQKEEILKEYLRGVLASKKKAIVLSGEGVGVKTPTVKPKTLSEAGNVAIKLFTQKN